MPGKHLASTYKKIQIQMQVQIQIQTHIYTYSDTPIAIGTQRSQLILMRYNANATIFAPDFDACHEYIASIAVSWNQCSAKIVSHTHTHTAVCILSL